MKGLLIAAGVAALSYYAGKHFFNNRFAAKVKTLFKQRAFSNSSDTKGIKTLPLPVQRYMKKALDGNITKIENVRLKHEGFFKTALDKEWAPIMGEQYYTAAVPGFVWKGKTGLFSATDSFLEGKGNLSVWLFSAFKIISKSGNTMDQAELLRWLGEGILFPTVSLTNDYISWEAVDDRSAKLVMKYNRLTICYTVTFNENDEVKRMETKRYYNNGKLEKWIGRFKNYKHVNGFYIPTTVEGGWILDDVEYPYAKFYITTIEYNKPQMF